MYCYRKLSKIAYNMPQELAILQEIVRHCRSSTDDQRLNRAWSETMKILQGIVRESSFASEDDQISGMTKHVMGVAVEWGHLTEENH